MTLGTVDYLRPRILDASSVDVRADIFSLGATLYWCLTAVSFPGPHNIAQALLARQTTPPPSPRALCADVLPELDAIIVKTMAIVPSSVLPSRKRSWTHCSPSSRPSPCPAIRPRHVMAPARPSSLAAETLTATAPSVLLADDDAALCGLLRLALENDGYRCREAGDGHARWRPSSSSWRIW